MILSTLAAPARLELIVRKSRFLALATAIDSAEHAPAYLNSVYCADASHHCWAYRIGGTYRSSDDGEPAGTAGRPILAAIDGQLCDHVIVVVAVVWRDQAWCWRTRTCIRRCCG
jgi:putative IMPACT (imprinted ancient) family translation regulator